MKERIKTLREKFPSIQDVIKASTLTEEELALANYSGTSSLMIGARSALRLFLASELFNTRLDATKWEANWKDTNEPKWFPIFDMSANTPSGVGFSRSAYDLWLAHSGCGSRFAFEFEELSDLSAELYVEDYIGLLTK